VRVVWLHGLFGHGADFEPVQAALSSVFEHLNIPLPGHDSPGLRAGVEGGFEEASSRVVEAIGRWTSEPVWLVGYSMGARVAMHVALSEPSPVKGLVLIGGHPGLTSVAQREERLALDHERASRLESEGLAAFLQAWYELPLFGSLRDRSDFHARLESRLCRDPDAVSCTLRRLSTGHQADLRPLLSSLSLPIHWVYGAEDSRYAAIYNALGDHPHWRRHAVPEAAHSVHIEQPTRVAEILRVATAAIV
jgi:2-succinyl-6-hydroxy-2,4-cyclohexadiene-1-carboxylate synthase